MIDIWKNDNDVQKLLFRLNYKVMKLLKTL